MIFYIDASLPLAVRTSLAAVRDDVRYAGGPGAPAERAKDREWLPFVGERDWAVVMRDKRIRTRPGERRKLVEAGVRAFCLTGAGNYTRWQTLRILAARWPRIEQIATDQLGPYIYAVTWGGVEPLPLAADL